MERVGTLINKLKDQFEQQADADKLAQTAQLILAELQFKQTSASPDGVVSVVMPSVHLAPQAEMPIFVNENKTTTKKEKENTSGWLFDAPIEIPTLSHQSFPAAEPIQINDAITPHQPILNDQLKEDKIEVAAKLEETPIRDLRKAISINDRYLFAHMLFRGDENMYERSIKTINSFSIYPEAQYWIQRELKVKLGWQESNETVKHFDQIIKRRFS